MITILPRLKAFLLTATVMAGSVAASQATIIGFGQIGGSNTAIPGSLGSNAAADGTGFTVTNGATPNISLTWHAEWDIHRSTHFTELENQTAGGGLWDKDGNDPQIGQLEINNLWIDFSAGPGFAVVLNSFDFANSPEVTDTSVWNLALTDAQSNVVWNQTVTLANNDSDVLTVSPNFVGQEGQTYRLTFTQTTTTTATGHHGIDNLSFNQAAIPEPSLAGLSALGGLALAFRRRK